MTRYCCPECYRPIRAPKLGQDGRCQKCRDDLPVNGKPKPVVDDLTQSWNYGEV